MGGQDDSSDPEEAEEQEEQEQGAQGGHCTTEEPARAESATAPHQILSSPSDTGVPSGAGHPAPAPAEPQAQAGASSSTDFTAIPGASDSGIDAAGVLPVLLALCRAPAQSACAGAQRLRGLRLQAIITQ